MILKMSKLVFFYHKRRDDAVRIGIEVDEERLLETYTPGQEFSDSALLWYADVRCSTEEEIDADSETARKFFMEIATPVKVALDSIAEELRAGLDSDIWPNRWPLSQLPPGIQGEIVCSAMRRVTDGELGQVIKELAHDWEKVITTLQPTPYLVS